MTRLRLVTYPRRRLVIEKGTQFYYQNKLCEVIDCTEDKLIFKYLNPSIVDDENICIIFQYKDFDVFVRNDYNPIRNELPNNNESNPFLNEPIDLLELPPSVDKALKAQNIKYVYDLTRLTEDDILSINRIGKTNVNAIKEKLTSYNLCFSRN